MSSVLKQFSNKDYVTVVNMPVTCLVPVSTYILYIHLYYIFVNCCKSLVNILINQFLFVQSSGFNTSQGGLRIDWHLIRHLFGLSCQEWGSILYSHFIKQQRAEKHPSFHKTLNLELDGQQAIILDLKTISGSFVS